jgi:hypothetical protein
LFIPQIIHEYEEPQWNDNDRAKLKNLDKNLFNTNLSTIKSAWIDVGTKPGVCCEKPVTNHLSHGMTLDELSIVWD